MYYLISDGSHYIELKGLSVGLSASMSLFADSP